MSYFDGFTVDYTFRLQIERSDRMILDTAITVKGEQNEINKAKEDIQRLLTEYTPVIQAPHPQPEGSEPEVSPESKLPPLPEKKPEGVRGLLRLRCPECGNTFGTFLREYQTEVICRCGHPIDLTGTLARYHFTCPYCEHEGFGKTNLEDPDITVRCKCGVDVDLRWVPEAKEYRN